MLQSKNNEKFAYSEVIFTFPTPEIKQASSASLQFLRLRRDEELEAFEETDDSESKAVSESDSNAAAVLFETVRRTLNPLGLGV